jgi:hypothetical protein
LALAFKKSKPSQSQLQANTFGLAWLGLCGLAWLGFWPEAKPCTSLAVIDQSYGTAAMFKNARERDGANTSKRSDSDLQYFVPAMATVIQYESVTDSMDIMTKLFRGWTWASDIIDIISSSQDVAGGWLEDYDGDRSRSYSSAITNLNGTDKAGLFRTMLLDENNPNIRAQLAYLPSRLNFIPDMRDEHAWDTLGRMHLVSHRTNLLNIGSKNVYDSTYDIWKVVQQFDLACRRPSNALAVDDDLFISPVFLEKFVHRRREAGKGHGLDSLPLKLGDHEVEFEIVDRRALSTMPAP